MAAIRFNRWPIWVLGGVLVLVLTSLFIWRDDILEALLDPQVPFAVYKPPAAPDYDDAASWLRLPGSLQPTDPSADIFFVHPTTFDGGRDWNGPIQDPVANRRLTEVMAPNYAAPYARLGRVYAPLYRQASLYASLTLFDDAIEARTFAYGDVHRAFQSFLARIGESRPFFIVGVEQGGLLADRILQEDIGPNPKLRKRLIGAYLIETVTPAAVHAAGTPTPACAWPGQSGCVLAWISAERLNFAQMKRIGDRSLVWSDDHRLVALAGREPLCVNPLLGAASDLPAPPRLNRGAANASRLEWGARPGLMARQIGAQCQGGILLLDRARSAELRRTGGWVERLMAPPYNLFWADLEADAATRLAAWRQSHNLATNQPR